MGWLIPILFTTQNDFPLISTSGPAPKHPIIEGILIGISPFVITTVIVALVFKFA